LEYLFYPSSRAMSDSDAAPRTAEEFRARLADLLEDLPRRMRQFADYIALNTDRIAVSTVADLAAGADVPPSAVMRFCQLLGFSGFSQMQRMFRGAYSPGWPDYATRLSNLQQSGAGSPSALLGEFIEAGRLSLEGLTNSVDEAALAQAVEVLAKAETIHVMGLRRAFPVACYLAYAFEKMAVPAMLHDGVGKLDHRFALRGNDALLAITFAPYSEETIALAQDAHAKGLAVVALTDLATGPLAGTADALLTVMEVDFGAFRSLSATIAMAIALAVAVGSARK
jgi:DNA-binding MurR/RpiR family transcriptional regulator